MYSLKIIILKDCFYSDKLIKIINKKHLNNIVTEYITVTFDNINKYKTDEIHTYPQVYMVRENKEGQLLVGGYDIMNQIINIINTYNYDTINTKLSTILPTWSDKAKLRLIQLIKN